MHNKITQELLIFQIQCEVTIAEESKFAMEKKSKCDTKQDVSLEEKENGILEVQEIRMSNDIDFLLEKVVGGGGWAQWIILICQVAIMIASGLPTLIHIFAAFEPSHRCYVSYCDQNDSANAIHTHFTQFALPNEYASSEIFKEDETFDPCQMYERTEESTNTCTRTSFNHSSIQKCKKWVYDTKEFTETLTSKSNLICDDEWKRRLLGTLLMLGLLIGSIIGGRVGDRFGRKITILWSHIILAPIVMFAGFSPNYPIYALLRFISATCQPIMWISGHVLTLELFGKEYRKSIAIVKDFFAPMSELVLCVIIYTTRHWTYIHIWAGVGILIPLPLYFFVPESPRWLAINGRVNEAKEILLNIGKLNGKTISENQKEIIQNTLESIQNDANSTKTREKLSPLDMLNKIHLRKTLILLFNWITIVVGVYTLSLNATKLSGDLFFNYALIVVAGSFPGTFALLLTLKLFGRRLNLFYTQFILGN